MAFKVVDNMQTAIERHNVIKDVENSINTLFSQPFKGEITGGKRLIKKLHKRYHHFADIIVADSLYCKSTWIKKVLSIGMNTVVRVKDERFAIEDDWNNSLFLKS